MSENESNKKQIEQLLLIMENSYNMDEKEATLNEIRRLAEEGNDDARLALAMLITEGNGVDKNPEKGFKIVEELTKNGNNNAKKALAALYSAGVGTPKNIKKGISLYEELAKEGDLEIQLQLGSIYYYGLFGVEIDKEKGMELIENCAKNGYDLAQMTLANILYENLCGKDEKNDSEIERVFYWLHEAGKNGNADADAMIGMIYADGIIVDFDYQKAINYYKNALEKGSQDAPACMAGLMRLYVPYSENYNRIRFSLFKEAVERGNINYRGTLGWCYLVGYGTEPNFKKSYELYKTINDRIIEGEKNNYYVNVFEQVKDREIVKVSDISKLGLDKLDENTIGGIVVSPEINPLEGINTIYSIKDYKNILQEAEEILSDIPNVSKSKDNEFDVFMQLLIKFGNMIFPDKEFLENRYGNNSDKGIRASNMLGGLLDKKIVCAGGMESFRNLLAMKGIESIPVFTQNHTFNQVKINGKWYYVDFINCCSSIQAGRDLPLCLLSEEDYNKTFLDEIDQVILPSSFKHPCPETFDQEKVQETARKFYKLYGITPDVKTKNESIQNEISENDIVQE